MRTTKLGAFVPAHPRSHDAFQIVGGSGPARSTRGGAGAGARLHGPRGGASWHYR